MMAADVELVQRAQAGDLAAFEQLVARYRDAAYGAAYDISGDFGIAQELAQEALVRAFGHLASLRDGARFGAWVVKIARNLARSWQRRAARGEVSLQDLQPEPVARDDPAHQAAERDVIRRALSALPEPNRLALTMFYINGYTYDEIGSLLEQPATTVRGRVHRGRRQLQQEVLRMMQDEFDRHKLDEKFLEGVRQRIERARVAGRAHRQGEALELVDGVLAELETAGESEEALRERVHALAVKRSFGWAHLGWEQATALSREIVALADRVGDPTLKAGALLRLGTDLANTGRYPEETRQAREEALAQYRELGDREGEAICAYWLGVSLLHDEPGRARELMEQSYSLRAAGSARDWGCAWATLRLLDELGDRSPSAARFCQAGCRELRLQNGAVRAGSDQGHGRSTYDDTDKALGFNIIHEAAHPELLLTPNPQPGDEWTEDSFSYTLLPLVSIARVVADDETIETAAGRFEGCLHIHTTTVPTEGDETSGEDRREWNKAWCGERDIWYAPGVGLVEVSVDKQDGTRGSAELAEYRAAGAGWWPLEIGNWWRYTWPEYVARYNATSVHEVIARDSDAAYLGRFAYGFVRGPGESGVALSDSGGPREGSHSPGRDPSLRSG